MSTEVRQQPKNTSYRRWRNYRICVLQQAGWYGNWDGTRRPDRPSRLS